jgi:putative transport protein
MRRIVDVDQRTEIKGLAFAIPPCVPYSIGEHAHTAVSGATNSEKLSMWYTQILTIITNPLVLLFALLTFAYGVDRLLGGEGRWTPVMILVVAPAFGWIADYELPEEIRTLGLVMFIYVVGLEAGPEFFPMFRRFWKRFILLGLFASGLAGVLAWVAGQIFGWSHNATLAFYAGAVTNTPTWEWIRLAIESDGGMPRIFNLSYFAGVFSAVCGIIVAHFIWTRKHMGPSTPVFFGNNASTDEPYFTSVHRCINGNVVGQRFAKLVTESMPQSLAIRYLRDDEVHRVEDTTSIHLDDLIVLVSYSARLQAKASILLGPVVEMEPDAPLLTNMPVRFETVTVYSPKHVAQPFYPAKVEAEFGVELRGWWRGPEFLKVSDRMVLRHGDRLRVLGRTERVRTFRQVIETEDRAHDEKTDLLRFSIGAAVGIFLAGIVFPAWSFYRLTLGITGGPLLAGLFFGQSAGIRIPRGAGFFLKELGLGLFLAGIGTAVGKHGALTTSEICLFIAAAGVVIVPMLAVGYLLRSTRLGDQYIEGGVCGSVTSTPALIVSCKMSNSSGPASTYAGVYFFALIGSIVSAQILFLLR